MKIEQIELTKEEAKKEYEIYQQAVKTNKEEYIRIMKTAFYHLKNGRKIIDIHKAFKKAGLDRNNRPRLAIINANAVTCFFRKQSEGEGIYYDNSYWSGKNRIIFPQRFFCEDWEKVIETRRDGSKWENVKEQNLQTKVPIVPPLLKPKGSLSNYFILWEPKNWEPIPPAKDPFLLKRISENLFVVLASWDVTPLEQSVIRGLRWKK